MTYTVLARRYRSRDFDEIVGQEPIARTLRNAVASGRTAHAYLFCGTRGVGKTSMARILAKAINVTDDLAEADAIAEAILRGDDLDVIEIDGASNRGIQEARDLIAAAGLSPARCRHKIYIIDEVHMLTTPAFNALLKTMEEPPAHVKFILCTTETQKVPATIQSRCQRFDFRALSTTQIAGQLEHVLDGEGVEADPEVVVHVARLGRGSMRDALSLLDRLLAAGEPRLTADLLDEMLGLPDRSLVSTIVDAIAAGDGRRALDAAAGLLARGSSVDQVLEMLVDHLRGVLIVATCGADSELLELSPSAREAVVRQAASFDAAGVVHLIAIADATARNARSSAVARALLDAALVRMCQSEHLADIATLLEAGGTAPPSRKKKDPSLRPPPPADDPDTIWDAIVAHARATPAELARVESLSFGSFDGRTLRLRVEGGEGMARWHAAQLDGLAALAKKATGRDVLVELDVEGVQRDATDETRSRIAEASRLPLVKMAMEIFDADVVDVSETQDRHDV